MQEHIINKLNSIYPLHPAELKLLLDLMIPIKHSKNYLLMTAGKIERYSYLLVKGIARAFMDAENQQTTFWFGQETDIILSYNSYINKKPGYEHIELLEDSVLYQIPNEQLHQLYSNHIGLSNWGRKLAEMELVKTEERLINRQFKPAKERYLEFLNQNPSLAKRVQLGYIASYLGVTQVTLSRIRAEI